MIFQIEERPMVCEGIISRFVFVLGVKTMRIYRAPDVFYLTFERFPLFLVEVFPLFYVKDTDGEKVLPSLILIETDIFLGDV